MPDVLVIGRGQKSTWAKSLQRALRLAIILPPLVFAAGYGYLRFITSPAFRTIIERLLSNALAANVTIGAHELSDSSRIVLRDLKAEFLTEGQSSGLHFGAKEAIAEAGWLLGVGPFERIVLKDVETDLDAPVSAMAKLDVLSRPSGSASVKAVVLEGVRTSFNVGDAHCSVSGMEWTFGLTGKRAEVSARLPVLRIEGLHTPGIDAEAPFISFRVAIEGPIVSVKELKVEGRSGWRVAGELDIDISREDPVVEGTLDLWDLAVKRIYHPPEGVEIPPLSKASRKVTVSGPITDLRIVADTAIRSFSYNDTSLGLNASGITSDLQSARRLNLRAVVRGYFAEGEQRE